MVFRSSAGGLKEATFRNNCILALAFLTKKVVFFYHFRSLLIINPRSFICSITWRYWLLLDNLVVNLYFFVTGLCNYDTYTIIYAEASIAIFFTFYLIFAFTKVILYWHHIYITLAISNWEYNCCQHNLNIKETYFVWIKFTFKSNNRACLSVLLLLLLCAP